MANILDYVTWRGDLPLSFDGWNAVDAVILATACYSDFPAVTAPGARRTLKELAAQMPPETSNEPGNLDRAELIRRMAASKRFGGLMLHDFVNVVDTARNIQFAAVTVDDPLGGAFVAFRGTDKSLVGWKEDFMMAFETPVPAQTAAVRYLSQIAARTRGPLRVAGHSKGGNLAIYAAMNMPEEVTGRIAAIYSFDGPGLSDAAMQSAAYENIRARIESFVPQASIVGLLLAYHPDYKVVKSSALGGISQHSTFTWQLNGPRFEEVEQVDKSSAMMDQTMHEWLRECTPEQRRSFVNTLFEVLESADTRPGDALTSVSAIIEAMRRVDASTARMVWQLLGRFVQIGADSLFDLLNKKPGTSDNPALTPKK